MTLEVDNHFGTKGVFSIKFFLLLIQKFTIVQQFNNKIVLFYDIEKTFDFIFENKI